MKLSTSYRPKLRVVYFDADEPVAEDHRPVLSEVASDRGRVRAVLWDTAAHGTGLLLLVLAVWSVGISIATTVLGLLAAFAFGLVLFCVWRRG